jgi:predicted DNA-binding protein (MmcQ/YjbR family)
VDDDEALRLIRRSCGALPEVDEGVLQSRPLFCVRGRRFAIFNGSLSPPRPRWQDSGQSLHLLTDPDEREPLRQDRRFASSPHHGDRGWFSLRLDREQVDWTEIGELIQAAYRQAAPLALRRQLDGESGGGKRRA